MARLERERDQKVAKAEKLSEEIKGWHVTISEAAKKRDSLNERSKEVERLHEDHLRRLEDVDRELRISKENMFKASEELFALRQNGAHSGVWIASAQGRARNLQARVHELDSRSMKQQEMLYNIEYQVQQLENKVDYAQGKNGGADCRAQGEDCGPEAADGERDQDAPLVAATDEATARGLASGES